MPIQREDFGFIEDEGQRQYVFEYTLSTSTGLKVKVISYGAGISDIVLPDKNGVVDHIVLGFDNLEGFVNSSYIGSTIGRFANRIANASFEHDGTTFYISANMNSNHLHGGKRGWDKFVWESQIKDDTVVFSLDRPDGDMGYPGTSMAQVSYSLLEDGSLRIEYQVMSSKATPVNVTNHAYFNLAGHASGEKGLCEHEVQINAEHYLPMDSNKITGMITGQILPVEGTHFDLRQSKNLGEALSTGPEGGYDHCFVAGNRGNLKAMANVTHAKSGRRLTVSTSEAGVQFYTGNYITANDSMRGRENTTYDYRGAFCLEPENYPDAPNKKHFPSSILYPGDVYKHTIIYKFETIE